MDIAAGAGFRRIHVRVRIDPDQADLLATLAIILRNSSDRSGGNGVIAAENEWESAGGGNILHCLGELCATLRNLRKILGVLCAGGSAFLLRDRDVAQILHFIAERSNAGIQSGQSQSRWSHVDTAASRTEIERRADNRHLREMHA